MMFADDYISLFHNERNQRSLDLLYVNWKEDLRLIWNTVIYLKYIVSSASAVPGDAGSNGKDSVMLIEDVRLFIRQ